MLWSTFIFMLQEIEFPQKYFEKTNTLYEFSMKILYGCQSIYYIINITPTNLRQGWLLLKTQDSSICAFAKLKYSIYMMEVEGERFKHLCILY